MINGRIGFFENTDGEYSLMRLLSFLITCSGLAWGFIEILFFPENVHTELILGVITLGVGGKGVQDWMERKKKSIKEE